MNCLAYQSLFVAIIIENDSIIKSNAMALVLLLTDNILVGLILCTHQLLLLLTKAYNENFFLTFTVNKCD